MREKVKTMCLQIDCIGDLHHLLPKYRNCKTINGLVLQGWA